MPNKTDSKINLPVPDIGNISNKNGRLEDVETLKLQELALKEVEAEPTPLAIFDVLDSFNEFSQMNSSSDEVDLSKKTLRLRISLKEIRNRLKEKTALRNL